MGAAVQRSYTAEDRERGLRELANCRGNRRLASQRLATRGVDVPHQTLQSWAQQAPARYAEILAEVEDQVHQTIATEYETLALKGIEAQHVLLGDLLDKRDQLTGKELATAINSTAMASGIATDKSSALRGRPTVIVENRSPHELLGKVVQALQPYIEGTAQEIEPGDTESDTPPEALAVVAAQPDSAEQRAQDCPPK